MKASVIWQSAIQTEMHLLLYHVKTVGYIGVSNLKEN